MGGGQHSRRKEEAKKAEGYVVQCDSMKWVTDLFASQLVVKGKVLEGKERGRSQDAPPKRG